MSPVDKRYHGTRKYREYQRDYQKRLRRKRRVAQFNLPPEVVKRLECGPCEICGMIGIMGIDHNHKTGKFRGLLCKACNLGLGSFRDDAARLKRAAEYLETKEL